MQHAAFLDIALVTDVDQLIVAADCRAEPDADALAESDFADQRGGVGDVRGWMNLGDVLVKLIDGYGN